MSSLSWNCRGLGNPQKIQELKDMVSSKHPSLIFLQETKTGWSTLNQIREQLNYEGLFVVYPVGSSGGLALLWKEKNSCSLISYHKHIIDVEVHLPGVPTFRFTGFYGYSGSHQRRASWNLLKSLKDRSQLPWCIAGDFNDILDYGDKLGRIQQPEWRINGFREAVNFCNLFDLGYVGNRLTWKRGRNSRNWVRERLDRALANKNWKANFPNAKVHHVESGSSDHAGIFLNLGLKVIFYVAKPFRFENSWMKELDIKQAVQTAWEKGSGLPIDEKIKRCGEYLHEWRKHKKQQFKTNLKQAKTQMRLHKNSSDPYSMQLFNIAKSAYLQALEQQSIYWKQRAKQHWLKKGDANTKYFHLMASSRRKKNTVTRLKDETGQWRGWDSGLEGLISSFLIHYSRLSKET